jgi:hypothetical protein
MNHRIQHWVTKIRPCIIILNHISHFTMVRSKQ